MSACSTFSATRPTSARLLTAATRVIATTRVDALERRLTALLNGTPGQRKALLKELIVEVRVESRDSIVPTFRLPTTPVRVMEAVVGRSSYNANRALVISACEIEL